MSTQTRATFLDRATPPHISTLVLMASLPAMTMNMFLPALPQIAEYYGTTYAIAQYAVAINLAFNAVLQLFIGPLADHYGRRPVTIAGIVLFCFATLGTIYAGSIWTFLFFRASQAAIVTAMVLSRAIIRDTEDGDRAASKIAYVTMGMAVVPMVTPSLGGFMAHHLGWQSIFWLLFYCGVALVALTLLDLGETKPEAPKQTLREQMSAIPALLASQRFLGYAFATAFASGAFFTYLGAAAYVGIEIYGLTEDKVGIYIGSPALGYFFGNWLVGKYAVRLGINRMMLIGGFVATAGLLAAFVATALGYGSAMLFFGSMITLGFGNGLQLPNGMTGSMSVRPQLAGTAAGFGGALMIGGGAGLSALSGWALQTGHGEAPVLALMAFVSVLAVLCVLWVIRREKAIGFA